MATRAVILAAGQGTRMRSRLPKVLHEVAGRPMINWVIESVRSVNPDEIVVVVGHGAEEVSAALPTDVKTCLQADQLGTGHATRLAIETMGDVSADTVIVLPGDAPLLHPDTLDELVHMHTRTAAAAVLLTAVIDDPTGYGRILRDGWDRVVGIVEEKDASASQRAIQEVNASMYAFQGEHLTESLANLSTDNKSGEYYLTDVIAMLAGRDLSLSAFKSEPQELFGVNTQDQLAAARLIMRRRIAHRFMEQGVWMQDPDSAYIDDSVEIARGARIYANVHLRGSTKVGAGAQVGPDTFIEDSDVEDEALVWYSVIRSSSVGPHAEVGPYVSLRPGTELRASSKAGTFVEMKATTIGEGSKVPHLSYLGDAVVGEKVNVGAGTITCNYDGVEKHQTVIKDGAFIGSDTMLVAPVEIGEDAVTAAGSSISKDVPDRALGVERAQQKNIPGYADRLDDRRRRKAES